MKNVFALSAIVLATAASGHAAIVITEVHPSGSGNGTYNVDWFELTNTGATAVDISGWKIDDSSAAVSTAGALRGVTSIGAGASAVFFEGVAGGGTDSTITTAFESAWFGAGAFPSGFAIGAYSGSGLGLSTGGDAVNIFDAGGTVVAAVTFGAATLGKTFDNAAGATGAISTLSVVGTNGAFSSQSSSVLSNAPEVGSPGVTNAVPEPSAIGLIAAGGLMALRRRRA